MNGVDETGNTTVLIVDSDHMVGVGVEIMVSNEITPTVSLLVKGLDNIKRFSELMEIVIENPIANQMSLIYKVGDSIKGPFKEVVAKIYAEYIWTKLMQSDNET